MTRGRLVALLLVDAAVGAVVIVVASATSLTGFCQPLPESSVQ